MALRNLGVEVNHLFACDVNKFAKATIMANFPPKDWYDDLTTRDNTKAKKADLYVAGFPCQPFSSAGLQQGFGDRRGRGTVFFKVREYIEQAQPKIFVLENVSGLVKIQGGRYFKDIIESLEELGNYHIHHQMLNTLEHGVPQNRRRIYFVGIKKSVDKGSFEWPEPLAPVKIEAFLDRKRGPVDGSMLPPKSAGTARANVIQAIKDLQAAGHDPFTECFVIDCDSSANRMKYMKDLTPCLTCSRYQGHWITNRGRRMSKPEMMRLQAMMTPTEGFKVVVPDVQLGRQIGNAMSVNVLERIFVRLLPAAGFAAPGSLRDKWEEADVSSSSTRKRASSSGTAGASKRARQTA